MIFKNALLAWREQVPFADDDQVEQDLILSAMLQQIYAHDALRNKLAFRGGTCLHKLFFPRPLRYSEDLDFVQIHAERDQLNIYRDDFEKNLDQKRYDDRFFKDINPLLLQEEEYRQEDAANFLIKALLPFIPLSKRK